MQSNPRSPASQKISSTSEQKIVKKSGPFRVRLSAEKEKKLPTVIVGLFSLREKAPTKKQTQRTSSDNIYLPVQLFVQSLENQSDENYIHLQQHKQSIYLDNFPQKQYDETEENIRQLLTGSNADKTRDNKR